MSQNPSHSNTPTFNKVESQTTARLYQHPIVAEQTTTSRRLGNFCMSMVLLVTFTSMIIMGLKSCADDADYQAQKYRELNSKSINQ